MLHTDPIGAALQDFMQGKTDAEIIVESNLTENDIIPVSYLFRNWEEMPLLEQEAINACKGKILDVGAGAGSHTLLLQERKADVTALDISEGAIAVMKARGVNQLLQQDALTLKDQKYDTLLMLMNGIGIAGDLIGLYRFLGHARSSLLNPGGQILLESSDILYMYEDEDGSVLLDLNAGYYGEITYNMKYKDHESGSFKWLFIDAGLLEEYAEEQGFTCEILVEGEYGNFLAKLTLQ